MCLDNYEAACYRAPAPQWAARPGTVSACGARDWSRLCSSPRRCETQVQMQARLRGDVGSVSGHPHQARVAIKRAPCSLSAGRRSGLRGVRSATPGKGGKPTCDERTSACRAGMGHTQRVWKSSPSSLERQLFGPMVLSQQKGQG